MMALDTDKDGRISRTEAMAGEARLADRFEKMDINKDGYLDHADRQARMTQQRAEFFKGADANRDGRITRDEFIVELGALNPEAVVTPGIFVQRIVKVPRSAAESAGLKKEAA